MRIFSSIDNREFFRQRTSLGVFEEQPGELGEFFQRRIQSPIKYLQDLGSEIETDFFVFRDGVACNNKVYTDTASAGFDWKIIERLHASEKATLYLRGLQKYDKAIAEVFRELAETHAISDKLFANLFVTPPNAAGLTAHYDPTDFVVFQLTGTKNWPLWFAVDDLEADKMMPKEASQFALKAASEHAPEQSILLRANRALYVPKNVIHAPMAQDSASCHVTLGFAERKLKYRLDRYRDEAINSDR